MLFRWQQKGSAVHQSCGWRAAALAQVGDTVRAPEDVAAAEAGLDAALASRVAAARRRVHASAPRRERPGARAARVTARPRGRRGRRRVHVLGMLPDLVPCSNRMQQQGSVS